MGDGGGAGAARLAPGAKRASVRRTMRRNLLRCTPHAAAVAIGLALSWAAPPPVVADERGVAIGGHDPVAYFAEGRPAPGSPAHEFRWSGAVWRFASAAARDRFAADPVAYAPRYRGWCAWALSENRLAPGNPRIWRIVDGRLYLNCNEAAQRRWEADLPAALARADANWARLAGSGE